MKDKQLIKYLYKTFLENKILSRWLVLIFDLFIVTLSTLISYYITLRIYVSIPNLSSPILYNYLIFTIGITLVYFLLLRTYIGIIRFSTIFEIFKIFSAMFLSSGSIFVYLFILRKSSGSISIGYCISFLLFSLLGLFIFRISVIVTCRYLQNKFSDKITEVFLCGVNQDSISMSQLLNTTQSSYKVKGFIEVGSKSDFSKNTNLPIIKKEVDFFKYNVKNVLFIKKSILIENRKNAEELIKKGINIYVMHDVNIHNLDELMEVSRSIRPIQIEDLLGRPEIDISIDSIFNNINDRVVLVSGAAGSIGSEIVRQLAGFSPKLVICVDQAETPLHELYLEIKKTKLNYSLSVTDITNLNKISDLFNKYKPEIVFHAAAYKHVPLMEQDPTAAIINNVQGTKHMVDLSIKYNVKTFVMISTDKAVNPTNVMGASKRIAEIYTQACALDLGIKQKTNTKFITTRFGNVLGSNGSVIPLFKRQILAGGPITVTHKNITRYFMTIPEACRLVFEASVIGMTGHIYIFDMGKPVLIYDLAKRMIELSGLRPHSDIKIEFTGLRPGEKLYEELLNDSEITEKTNHKKIKVAKVRKYTLIEIIPLIEDLIVKAKNCDVDGLMKLMKFIVPEYVSENSVFKIYDK